MIVTLMMLPQSGKQAFADPHSVGFYSKTIRQYFKDNKWALGKRLLDEAMQPYNYASEINELQGWYYIHYKKYDLARYYLIRSLRDDKSNMHARHLMVHVEEMTGNYSSAICYINEILEGNPYNKRMWRHKIGLFRRMKNNAEADRLLERLYQIYPTDSDIKRDIKGIKEERLEILKKKGDIEGQITGLRELVKMEPKNTEYYLRLANLLKQQGKLNDAQEIAYRGADETGSVGLMQKRVGLLREMGRDQEALGYMKEWQRKGRGNATIAALINEIETEEIYHSVKNDPYIMYGKLYEKTGDPEAYRFVFNTAMARGYYGDALEMIQKEKKAKGNSYDLMYKELTVLRAMGNQKAADALVEKLYAMQPKNSEFADDIEGRRWQEASDNVTYGDYQAAIPLLQYVESHTSDSDRRKSAKIKLFTCYYELKDYDKAEEYLETIKDNYSYPRYIASKVDLLWRRDKTDEAFALLDKAYNESTTQADKDELSLTCESLAVPYIKTIMENKLWKKGYDMCQRIMTICPNSTDLLRMAITCSSLSGQRTEYEQLIATARERYPEEQAYLIREIDIHQTKGDYDKALDLLRPCLNEFATDTLIVNAFVESSQLYAQKLIKAKDWNKAMPVVEDALNIVPKDRELLYDKGLIYEGMKQYDSAHVYQQYFDPTLVEYKPFMYHLEELKAKTMHHDLSLEYQQSRPGREDRIQANAGIIYSYHKDKNTYTGLMYYAGRDEVVDTENDLLESRGGIGVQLGGAWEHEFKNYTGKATAAFANKYYPHVKLRVEIEKLFENDHLHKKVLKNWTVNGHADYRRVEVNNGERMENMFTLGATASKPVENYKNFHVSSSIDLHMMGKGFYASMSGKMQFFPMEYSKTNVFATAALGTAPEITLIDNYMPPTFRKLNCSAGMGGMYYVNSHLSLGASGSWYTYYKISGATGFSYTNLFHVNGQIYIHF